MPSSTRCVWAQVDIAVTRAVLLIGDLDPWPAPVVGSAAGLPFAVDVATVRGLPDTRRPLFALDPDGVPLDAALLSDGPLLVFGGERYGVSQSLLDRADRVLHLPMRPQVSSLNLPTSVPAVLYAWRLLTSPPTAPAAPPGPSR
jgi:tRNA G18 (ribose-2'-O)-methylase SpoU